MPETFVRITPATYGWQTSVSEALLPGCCDAATAEATIPCCTSARIEAVSFVSSAPAVLRSARACFLPRRLHSAPMSRKPRHASREKEKCGSSDVPSRQPENSSSLSSSPRMSP